jgi:hypothetical protein
MKADLTKEYYTPIVVEQRASIVERRPIIVEEKAAVCRTSRVVSRERVRKVSRDHPRASFNI